MKSLNTPYSTRFAPMLFIKEGWKAIDIYKKAFNAVEVRTFRAFNRYIPKVL